MFKFDIVQVGCGGTGGYLALPLSKYVFNGHNETGLRYLLVDGDVVEPKNILRQNFFPNDIGKNKAEVIGERYGIESFPEFFTETTANVVIDSIPSAKIIIGCVDKIAPRKLMYNVMRACPSYCVYFDAGNMSQNGQVIVVSNMQELYAPNAEPVTNFVEMFDSVADMDNAPSCTELGDQTIMANFMAANYLFSLLTEFIATHTIMTTKVTFSRHMIERNTDYVSAIQLGTL